MHVTQVHVTLVGATVADHAHAQTNLQARNVQRRGNCLRTRQLARFAVVDGVGGYEKRQQSVHATKPPELNPVHLGPRAVDGADALAENQLLVTRVQTQATA